MRAAVKGKKVIVEDSDEEEDDDFFDDEEEEDDYEPTPKVKKTKKPSAAVPGNNLFASLHFWLLINLQMFSRKKYT